MAVLISFALFAAAAQLSLAHPTRYPLAKSPNCSAVSPLEQPDILSFHVHVVYGFDQLDAAVQFRDAARTRFASLLGSDCDGRYDNGKLCMITDHHLNETLSGGPFPAGEWSIFVPVDYYAAVVPFMTQGYGDTLANGLSLLVHPNTGCEFEDHSKWALWAGQSWPLDFSIFTQHTQTNEFGQTLGDAGNPVCLPATKACGTTYPVGPCCAGLSCVLTNNTYKCA